MLALLEVHNTIGFSHNHDKLMLRNEHINANLTCLDTFCCHTVHVNIIFLMSNAPSVSACMSMAQVHVVQF